MFFKNISKAILWLKRKVVLYIAAIMIGISNVIYEEEKIIHWRFHKYRTKSRTRFRLILLTPTFQRIMGQYVNF